MAKKQIGDKEWAAYDKNEKNKKLIKQENTLEEEIGLLERQKELRWTALNVFKAVAEHIPEGVVLDRIDFAENRNNDGNNITLRGRISQGDREKLELYSDALAAERVDKVSDGGSQPENLFRQVMPPNTSSGSGGYLSWYIICVLKRKEIAQ